MDTEMDRETETDMETETETDITIKWTWTLTMTWNWGTFGKYLIRYNSPYSAIWIDFTYHSAISNGAIYFYRLFMMKKMTCRFSKIHTPIGTALQTMC